MSDSEDLGRFTPNEVVGYAFEADPWNWRVVLVKKRSEPGEGRSPYYGTTLGHFKSLESAANFVTNHAASSIYESKVELIKDKDFINEDDAPLQVVDVDIMIDTWKEAREVTLRSIKELEDRLNTAGIKKDEWVFTHSK